MKISYLNFDLSIEPNRTEPPTYRVRVHDSPAGQADGAFTLPFSDLELENYILKMGRVRRGYLL